MLLTNALVHDAVTEKPKLTNIRLSKGKIEALSPALRQKKEEKTVDLKGNAVYPGFIDAHTHVGVFSEPMDIANQDGNEYGDPVTPHLRAIDAINTADPAFSDAVSAGVTTLFTGPGSANIFGGQSCVIKTAGSRIVDERILSEVAGMKAALGENPKRVYGEMAKKLPSTRMGNAAIMREQLILTQNYIKQKKGKNPPTFDIKKEALIPVLTREIPLRCHAHRADDIVTAVRIKKEFDIELVIEHCTEGHLIADFLAEEHIPCVVGPSLISRMKEELKHRSFQTTVELEKRGVLFAIMTDHPVLPIHSLPQMAGYAIHAGLPPFKALQAITINAARICGVDHRVGSIEPGKDADLTIYKNNPFSLEGISVMTIVNGEIVYEK